MPVYVSKPKGDFEPCPPGLHQGVCVDVVDLGLVDSTFNAKTKKQHMVRIVWQIGEDRADGKPFMISRRYKASLHEKASLRKDLESWRGRPFADAELDRFDLEALLGANCQLNVIHEKGQDGNSYDRVQSIVPLGKGMGKLAPRDYVRVKDRDDYVPPPNEPDEHEVTDDDIPF